LDGTEQIAAGTQKTSPPRPLSREAVERLESEQAALDTRAREAEDRETARRMAAMGLKIEPGRIMASPVKIYSTPEEIAAIAREITPITGVRKRKIDVLTSF